MQEAVKAGAEILNDIRAFREPEADVRPPIPAQDSSRCTCRERPRTMQAAPHYEDVVREVEAFLLKQEAHLLSLGAEAGKICFDPGFGFGKTVEQNFRLLAATERFAQLGRPYLMALSRKVVRRCGDRGEKCRRTRRRFRHRSAPCGGTRGAARAGARREGYP